VGAVALLARLAVVACAGTRFPPAHDGVRYDALAARLATGHGYSWLWPDGSVTVVAHYPVGYPALLSLAYRLAGHSVVAAGVANALLGTLAALAVHRMVLAVASPRTAAGAGLAVALHPGLVLYTPGIMTEGATAALVTLAAWLAVRARTSSSPMRLVLLGVVLGAAALVRPQTLVLAPAFGAIAARGRGAAVCSVVAALACAPWVARNCGAVDRCTISTNTGWNLLIGAQSGATGSWQEVHVPTACKEVFGESTTDACFGREAGEAIASDPLRWLALVPRKLGATFDYGGIGGYYLHLSNPAVFPWTAVLVAGGIETVFERLALGGCLLGAARADGPRRRTRRWLAAAGAVFLVLPWGWVAVIALCAALALAGLRWLDAHPVHAATLVTLAATAAVHAVFFGAPRYALIAAPLVTALGAMAAADALRARRTMTNTPGPPGVSPPS
jgi:4-amino-4-deoxy-L-arabinose transferase-like glycosyltransferase